MKRIVIVGATSGIGLEVAKLCIREGWRVGAAGRREEALEALRATAPEQVETEPLDITRDDAPGQLARLIDKLGGMDIYLHCSGIGKRNTDLLPESELDGHPPGFRRHPVACGRRALPDADEDRKGRSTHHAGIETPAPQGGHRPPLRGHGIFLETDPRMAVGAAQHPQKRVTANSPRPCRQQRVKRQQVANGNRPC